MRHRKKGRKLNRTASHKKAMLRNIANQLFEHKEIRTTTAKAKEARPTVERLITYAKKGDLHHRRLAFSFLRQKSSIKTLFDEIAPTFAEREGGYTRVIKLGRRLGDGAPMSILQLVGFETLGDTVKKEAKKKTRKKETKTKEASPVKTDTAAEEKPAAGAVPQESAEPEDKKADQVPASAKPDVADEPAAESKSEEDKKIESAEKNDAAGPEGPEKEKDK